MTVSQVCDWIILFGAVALALTNIYNFLAKPQKKLKEKRDSELREEIKKVLDDKMPKLLEKHSEEVAQERSEERKEQLEEVRTSILAETKETLDGILQINIEQNKNIAVLMTSSKDILRQRIMDIYHRYKREKRFPIHAKEALDELYKDYKAENGNSYIDKYYKRMSTWEEYDDEEENFE